MLHGLLLVLKIAGIILAVLLGIVLAAAAAVLFVPVRYAADAQYDKNSGKKPVLHVRVTWLLHLFRFFMEYNEGFKMRAQVLFFPLYDSERPIEPEIKEQKEKASKKKQKAGERTVFDEQPQKSGVQAQEVRKRIEQEPPQETGSETEAEQTAEENPRAFRKKPSLAEKFKCFVERIKQVCRRIKAFFIRIAQTICGIFDKSVSLKETVQEKTTHFSEMLKKTAIWFFFYGSILNGFYKNPVRKNTDSVSGTDLKTVKRQAGLQYGLRSFTDFWDWTSN